MPEHRSGLSYSTDDDGIWLGCYLDGSNQPHWTVNLGFDPSVVDVMTAWSSHVEEED